MAAKDNISNVYVIIILGVVFVAFFGGFLAGKQKQ
jgi:hypothetical protein